MSGDRKKDLEDKGIFCDIIQRHVRGQKELTHLSRNVAKLTIYYAELTGGDTVSC